MKEHGYKSALLNDLDLCACAYGFDCKAISYVKELIIKCNAELVISSSWKFSRDLQTLKALFSLHELDCYLRDMTSNAMGFMKEDGILDYIETHSIEHYVVLDDIPMEEAFQQHAIGCPDVFDEKGYQKALHVLLS